LRAVTLRRGRKWVQLAALLLFLVVLVAANRVAWLPADLFFRVDPLAGLVGMLAARQIVVKLLIGAALMLAATVVLGRFWCGWLCPLGTVLDWTPSRLTRPKDADLAPRWRQVKHFLLALIVLAALLGNLSLLFLDPITLTFRTGAAAAWPALDVLVSGAERIVYVFPFLTDAVVWLDSLVRDAVLPMAQPFYGASVLAALLFVGVLALNAVRPRFWCRYLCPLGALLGLTSKLSLLRRTVGTTCIECQRCARACPTGTIDATQGYASDPAECIMCLECVPVCAKSGQYFVWRLPWRRGDVSDEKSPAPHWRPYDPSRRQFLASAGAAVAAVGLLGSERAAGHDEAHLIRPPGANKPEFAAQCIRCGVCIKTCPTSGLQPSLATAGWGGLWTPVLVPRLGYCLFSCNACGQACPTGAIPPLSLEEKQVTVIGHAYIDRSRCIPWADGQNCIVCQEMCPLPEKAIQLEETEVWTPNGPATVKRPYVLHDRCIGCGICETRCPLSGEAAIRISVPSQIGAQG
jgi:MauM/NapG family ferredoxin protein